MQAAAFDPLIYAADPSISWHIPFGTPAAREVESLLRRLEIPAGSVVTIADADGYPERQFGDLTVWPLTVCIEPEEGDALEVDLCTDGSDPYRESGDSYVTVEWLSEALGLAVRENAAGRDCPHVSSFCCEHGAGCAGQGAPSHDADCCAAAVAS